MRRTKNNHQTGGGAGGAFASEGKQQIVLHGLKKHSCPAKHQKTLKKMDTLARCQINFMQVLFQKIDRKSKPIKKLERAVNMNLKKKRIYLESDNFDILNVLKSASKTVDTAASPINNNLHNLCGSD